MAGSRTMRIPTDVVTFAAAAEQAARGVDGKYAGGGG